MRALRSHTVGTTSSFDSNNPEDSSSTQEHALDERKPKKIRQKKLKKQWSQDNMKNDDVFTSVKISKKPEQNDCPTSSDDTFIIPKSRKKRRSTCWSEIEPSILFENAITSTQVKPKKHRKSAAEPIELEVAPQIEEAIVVRAETITPPHRKKKQKKIKKTPGTSSSTCTSENTTIIETKTDGSTFQVNNETNVLNFSTDHKSKFIVTTVDDTTTLNRSSQKELEYDSKVGTSQKKKKRKSTSQNASIIKHRNTSILEDTNQTSKLEANDEQQTNLIFTINETTKFGSPKRSSSTFECSPQDSTLTNSETKVSIFNETNDPNDYLMLDDISDVVINDIINISDDSMVKNNSRRGTFNISSSQINGTFIKDMSPDLDHDKKRDTFDVPVYNNSGEWQVQYGSITLDNSNDAINKTPDNNWSTTNKTPRNNRATNQKILTINTPNKSIKKSKTHLEISKSGQELNNSMNTSMRKKWKTYAVNTPEAKAVLGNIYSPKPNKYLTARKSTNVSILKHSMLDVLNSPKSNISTRKSTQSTFKSSDDTLNFSKSKHKSQVKAMPNFALIHKKAFDKMESIQDYSDRKQERAKLLMSTDKISASTSNKLIANKENQTGKSSRQLFSNSLKNKDYNRFGFKVKPQVVKKGSPKVLNNTDRKKSGVSENRIVIAKPIRRIKPPEVTKIVKPATIKDPIFERKDLIAMGNKHKVEDPIKNRNKRRDDVRGFRTNRRFELLMKMRNNE